MMPAYVFAAAFDGSNATILGMMMKVDLATENEIYEFMLREFFPVNNFAQAELGHRVTQL
ncbi:hypothetical protein AB8810_24010 [Xanthomonas sp. NCPPB 3005]|jgi:hypothetical protein|uniref:hypothetical protein n=1 Tax=Xanthomonas sp. NCPPB 3005 TaxID=3240913 RepID=UPI00355987FE